MNLKVEGKEVTAVGHEVQRAQVIDLMDALKQSLAKRVPQTQQGQMEKKPAVKAKRAEPAAEKPASKAQATKK